MPLTQGQHPQRATLSRLDQSGDENIFPLLRGQQWPIKTAEWNTTVIKSKSGRIFRKQNYTYPIWKFAAKYSTLSQKPTRQEQMRLLLFFNSRAGGFGDFLYFDPSDHLADNTNFGTGNGVTTVYQLRRKMVFGTLNWNEPIFAVNGSPSITVGGDPETGFILLENGRVQFDVAPAAGELLRWSGTFLFKCHFTQDELTVEQMTSLLWSSEGGLEFESLRP